MNTLVKDYPLNIPFLEAVAELYVRRPVRVELVDTAAYRGEASKRGGVDTIKLSSQQPLSLFAHSFFHETAHCCLHQSEATPDSNGVVYDIADATAKAQAKPDSKILELIRQRIEHEENEAEDLAHKLERDHWKRCGSFLEAAMLRRSYR